MPAVSWDIDDRELRRKPTVNPVGASIYQGRAPAREPGYPSEDKPCEARGDGCPGGWYRTPFVDSVIPYLRRRIDGGGRVSSPAFERADHLVQAAAFHVEHEEERWHGEIAALLAERADKEAAKKAKEAKRRGGSRYGRRR